MFIARNSRLPINTCYPRPLRTVKKYVLKLLKVALSNDIEAGKSHV